MTLSEFAVQADMDLKGTMERFSNMEALLKRFLKKFPQDKTFGELEAAMEKKDYDEILRAAHTLKGVAGNLGLKGLFDICQEIVDEIRGGDCSQVEKHFETVRKQYEKVIQCLGNLE